MSDSPIFRDGIFYDLDVHRQDGGIFRDGIFRDGIFLEVQLPSDLQLRFSVKPGPSLLFDLPVFNGGNYDLTYYTSEDPTIKPVTAWNDANAAVTFLTDVEHTIFIDGIISGFSFEGSLGKKNANNDKMRDMKNVGSLEVLTENYSFFDCPELTWSAIDAINKVNGLPANVESMWELDQKLTVCETVNVSDWSNVVNAQGCFDSDILLNQGMNLNTSSNVNFKWFAFGCKAQTLLITVDYTSAENCEGQYEECDLYNHPIIFTSGPAMIPMVRLRNFLKKALAWNQNISNMGWEFMPDLENCEGFLEDSAFDRDANVDFNNSVPDGLNLKKFYKNTPLGDRTITMDFRRVGFAQDMYTGCFSQSVVSWSDFLVDLQDQLLNLNDNVRIDAAAQHNQAGHDAIADIASTRNWIINDGGHGHA